jgi:DNA-binding transcriptional LysR family regulator
MRSICYDSIQMADPLLETAELLAFTKVVEARSLTRAALELEIPRATLGRRLSRLESRLGARLLRRTTRSIAITDAGEALYQRARQVLDAVAQAEASVRQGDDAVRGQVRVSVPPLMTPEFADVLCGFAARYPDVRLQVDFSSRHVDLRREGFDVAIRGSNRALEPGLVARVLSRGTQIAVASPSYLAANGTPKTARDLKRHRCLMGFARGERPETHWPRIGGGQVQVQGTFFTNELRLLGQAVFMGLGIALLPEFMVRPLIAAGDLVQVLAGVVGSESRASLVYAERELMPPQVRAFIDWVVEHVPPLMELPRVCEERVLETKRRRSRAG